MFDVRVLVLLLLLVLDDSEYLDLNLLKSQERYQRSSEHLQDFITILQLFLDDGVRRTECSHTPTRDDLY